MSYGTHYGRLARQSAYSIAKGVALPFVRRLRNVELLAGVFPDETGGRIADRTFRLCHCDVDVYLSAADVLEWVWPRLSAGGVVVFDDYGFPACPGVTRLVDEQRRLPDRLVFHNLNGHGVIVKR